MYKDKLFFLLGGADLEMLTIREILLKNGIPFADHQLQWNNAVLSSYQKELQQLDDSWVIYGVELQDDILTPTNYRVIDHHNQLSSMPSALEQVIDILHIPMDRYMQLVAINDKAYIPGMQAMGATAEEIESIRLADRKAQGVTEEDEHLAEMAISEHLEKVGNLTIVYSETSRFSPICDRLFPFHQLVVYTDHEWMYYGKDAESVRSLFADESSLGNLFYGGGKDGYIGIKQHIYGKEVIKEMVDRIIKSKTDELL